MDAGERGAGVDDDGPGLGSVLRRIGATQEHSRDHDAKLRDDGADHGVVGARGIQFVFWWKRSGDWRFWARVFAWRGRRSESGLCRNNSADDIHDLPVDVRSD